MASPVMPQHPTQPEFLADESVVGARAWQDQRTPDLVPPLASGDQLRHLGSSYETQYKQESAICEMGFNGDLAQQQFWEAHVRFGSFASGSGRPPLQPCPLCPESDVRPPKC